MLFTDDTGFTQVIAQIYIIQNFDEDKSKELSSS
jgi:hypothetical protein